MSAEPVIPQCLFFDSNILLGAGWPAPSAQLLQTLDQAHTLGIGLCLPELVAQEVAEHWIRDVNGDWQDANNGIERLNRRARAIVKFPPLAALPDRVSLFEMVEKMTTEFKSRFTPVKVTSRPLNEFLTLAITRGATFEKGGKGFQDAVLLCSVLDHMKEQGIASAALVAVDKAFRGKASTDLIAASGVVLEIIPSLDDLEKRLKEHLTAKIIEFYENQQRQLIAVLNGRLAEIEEFIVARLSVTPREIGECNATKISSLSVDSIATAHATTGGAWWKLEAQPSNPDEVQISVDVNVTVALEVRRYSGPPEKRLKVGADEVVSPDVDATFLLGALLPGMKQLVVVVEAQATKTEDGYAGIVFTGTYVKRPALGSLTSIFSGF